MKAHKKEISVKLLVLRAFIVTVLVLILLTALMESGVIVRGEDTPPQQVENVMEMPQGTFRE